METSPFRYQGPLAPDELRGRDSLLADLTRRVTEHRVTALLGPRRYGKTSVLDRLVADLGEVSTVAVDLYGVQSPVDVATRVDDALARAPAAFRTAAQPVTAKVGINLGAVRAEFARARRHQPDPTARLSQLLDVIVEAARRVPTLLVLDEFPDIERAPGAAGLMRTKLQRDYHRLGLLFAGSRVSAMRAMFADRDQPFYGQADLVPIGPLDPVVVHELVAEGFTSTGRDPGNVAAAIHALTGGHPQRTMLLADAAWRHTPEGGDAEERWGEALTDVRAAVDPTMRTLHDHLEWGEQRVLRLLAHDAPLHGATAKQLRLTGGTVSNAHRQLTVNGHLHDGGAFVDPLFADWFRQTLPLT